MTDRGDTPDHDAQGSKGFFAVQRRVWNHQLFKKAPMSETEAWLWLISRAAYKDTTHRIGAGTVIIPRGSFVATLREMQHNMLWSSDQKVRGFLKMIEQEGMIRRTTVGARNIRKTHVTICNYETYQSAERTEVLPVMDFLTHERRTNDAVNNNKTIKQTSSLEIDYDFVKFLDAHPKPHDTPAARSHFADLVESGICPQEIIGAAAAYKKAVSGFSTLNFVQRSDNFISPDRGKWKTYIQPSRQRATKKQIMEYWSASIKRGDHIPMNAISETMAREMIIASLVTEELLKEKGVLP